MSAAFTKAPWPLERTGDGKRYIVGKGLVEGPNGYDVAEVYSDDCDPDEAEANAHLIAAAPELYEALSGIQWKSADRDNMEFAATITYSRMDRIDAALRKARGEA